MPLPIQPIDYTPKQLLKLLLPPKKVAELKQQFPQSQKIIETFCADIGTISVYYREMRSLQTEMTTLIQSLVKNQLLPIEKKEEVEKIYTAQFNRYIDKQSTLIVSNLSSYLLQHTEAGEQVASPNLTILTEKNWEKFHAFPITIVDFWASWCQPCKILTPVLEALAQQLKGKVGFGKVDVDKESRLVKKYQIQSMPTLLIFQKGKEYKRLVGLHPESTIKAALEDLIPK